MEWGWGRQQCEDYLFERFGIVWKKSYCVMCCFPNNIGSLPAHLDRLRTYPDIAGQVLRLEYTSTRLNPNGRLFGDESLLEQFTGEDPRDADVLAAFEQELRGCPWTLYRVRRILPVSGKDPAKRAPALRSLERVATGDRRRMARVIQRRAAHHGLRFERDAYGSVRAWRVERGLTYPAVESFIVSAPGHAQAKEQARFADEWATHTGQGQLPAA